MIEREVSHEDSGITVSPRATQATLGPPISDDRWHVLSSPWALALRDDALAIIRAAIDAAEPGTLVRKALAQHPIVGERVTVVAVGKGAAAMAAAAADVLGSRIARGIIVTPVPVTNVPERFENLIGDHPIAGERSAQAGRAVRQLAQSAAAEDVILLLVSGGASAMLTVPADGISIEDYAQTTSLLLAAGADIGGLNCVRKHIDLIKGGRLAQLAAPAHVAALVLSDVVGDRLDTIASGPVTPDPTTYADALSVLRTYDLLERIPASVRAHLTAGAAGNQPESMKPGDPAAAHVTARVIGGNELARNAAAARAQTLGYRIEHMSEPLRGNARVEGAAFARHALAVSRRERLCIVAGGETTVQVTGEGRGGRNQELALAAALELARSTNILVASVGTDGIDGPTSAAGAVADGESVARAEEHGVDLQALLADNDAFAAFAALHDLVITGPTGTNVMDLQIALITPD